MNYAVYIQGTINYLYGTSASTPVFAGIISLINAEREKIGLGTVGFINPTLYSVNNTEKYNDITIGSSNTVVTLHLPHPMVVMIMRP